MSQQGSIRRQSPGKDPVLPAPKPHGRRVSALGLAFALLAVLAPIWSCSGSPTAPDTTALAGPAAPVSTTPPPPLSNAACVRATPATITAQDVDTPTESPIDGINIVFDAVSLTAALSDEPTTDPNRLLFLDVDVSRPAGFAIEQGPGAGWTTVSDTFPSARIAEGVDAASGSYSLRAQRVSGGAAGGQYDLNLTVTVSTMADGVSMAVSGLEACPV